MCNLMHNGIKCNDVYLQRCFNHLTLLTFIEKVKICEINIISCGCPKNNTGYGILLRDIEICKKFVWDIAIKISYLMNDVIKKTLLNTLTLIFVYSKPKQSMIFSFKETMEKQ